MKDLDAQLERAQKRDQARGCGRMFGLAVGLVAAGAAADYGANYAVAAGVGCLAFAVGTIGLGAALILAYGATEP